MRRLSFALLALAGCNPGVTPPQDNRNETAPARELTAPAAQAPANMTTPANGVETTPTSPPASTPGLAEMSPYRRREYERGWRDCMTGNFDRERQGESYRIGCMAAEDAKQRRSGR